MGQLPPGSPGRRWVGVVAAATGVAAVGGGVGLMINGLGMPDSDAPDLPFSQGWTLPGLTLLGLVGGGQLAAATAELRGHPRAPQITTAAGAAMVGIELAEFALIPFSWLTPAFLGVGLVEMASGISRWRRR